MSELHELSAHALAAKLRAREITAVAALAHFEQRISVVNPAINAVVATQWEVARARATEADAAAMRGEFWGPLHGVPMTVKEGFDVAGMATTVGDRALKHNIATRNAVAVQRLLDAGAVIFGKTNVPLYMSDLQCSNAVYGQTNNPWDLARTPGGSSGGAAAALAAQLTPLELGSDLAGSIRTPAHFCGVSGHRPTFDLVPVQGHFIGTRTHTGIDFTVAGPMARTVDDLELGLNILAGPLTAARQAWPVCLPAPKTQCLQDFRVGVWLDDASTPLDTAVRAQFDKIVVQLKAMGCRVVEGAPLDLKLDDIYPLYFELMAASVGGGIPEKTFRQVRWGARIGAWFGATKTQTLLGYAKGMAMSHRQWCEKEEQRARLRERIADYFADIDVLLMPVTQTAAPPHADRKAGLFKRRIEVNGQSVAYADQMKWITLSALLGLPSTSVPVGCTATGMPVGMQIVGAELHDRTTLAFARELEKLNGGFVAPPAR